MPNISQPLRPDPGMEPEWGESEILAALESFGDPARRHTADPWQDSADIWKAVAQAREDGTLHARAAARIRALTRLTNNGFCSAQLVERARDQRLFAVGVNIAAAQTILDLHFHPETPKVGDKPAEALRRLLKPLEVAGSALMRDAVSVINAASDAVGTRMPVRVPDAALAHAAATMVCVYEGLLPGRDFQHQPRLGEVEPEAVRDLQHRLAGGPTASAPQNWPELLLEARALREHLDSLRGDGSPVALDQYATEQAAAIRDVADELAPTRAAAQEIDHFIDQLLAGSERANKQVDAVIASINRSTPSPGKHPFDNAEAPAVLDADVQVPTMCAAM
ncbi:hypothetical protein ACIGO9_30540 [Nocardia asteroides]|uniref:hypothetical protein n=1 Tax=Nocardia asteroides TaxID=1824 RepID=UPI0037C568E9